MNIKYPMRAKRGDSGVWIEAGDGIFVCGFNHLLLDGDEAAIFEIAEEIASAWNKTKADDQTPFTDALRAQLAKERGEV